MILFLAMVFLLPLTLLVLYVLLFITGKPRFLIGISGIATAAYIYWLTVIAYPGRMTPKEGVSYFDMALVPSLFFISILVLSFYAWRRGVRAVSA